MEHVVELESGVHVLQRRIDAGYGTSASASCLRNRTVTRGGGRAARKVGRKVIGKRIAVHVLGVKVILGVLVLLHCQVGHACVYAEKRLHVGIISIISIVSISIVGEHVLVVEAKRILDESRRGLGYR